jgi:hypothetical protein
MVRVITRANDPIDWSTGQPIKGTYDLESHHIFPKSLLYETYDGMDSDDRKLVNEIANRVFITPGSNKKISDQPPSEYLPEIRERNPSALKRQFIPENEDLWQTEYYEEFLKRRRELLAEAINEFIDELVDNGSSERGDLTIQDLLDQGENEQVEFKETMLWDVYQNQPNTELKTEIAKEVCAFANKDGGTVIVGVNDQKEPVGVDRDLNVLNDGLDDFELQINQELRNRLGNVFSSVYTELEFKKLNGSILGVIKVEQSPDPIYFETDRGKEFIVRQGSSSIPLDVEEAQRYQEENF